MNFIHIDLETKSFCDLKKHGVWVYSEDPTTDIICMAWGSSENKISTWKPGESIPIFNLQNFFVARFARFEHAIFTNVLIPKYGFQKELADPDRWIDTTGLSYMAGMPGSLQKCAETLNIKYAKLETGSILINRYSKPVKTKNELAFRPIPENDFAEFQNYNIQDVRADMECFNTLWKLPNANIELPAMQLDLKQNINGLNIDTKTLNSLIIQLEKETERAVRRTTELGINVRSPQQVKEYLKTCNIKIENTQENTISELLKNSKLPENIKELLELRLFLAKASAKKLYAIKNMTSKDGKIRHFLQYHGAHTGRYTGRGFQPHNLPKTNTTVEDIEDEIKNIENKKALDLITSIKKILPGLIIPSKGKVFLTGDFAAIETRALAFVAEEQKILDAYQKNQDLYINMASVIYRIPAQDITIKQRQLGKMTVLGCGYGMGVNKFKETCENNKIKITEKLAEIAVFAYRSTHAQIPKFWKQCEQAFIIPGTHRVNKFLTITREKNMVTVLLPSGRTMYYHRVQNSDEGLSYWNFFQNRRVPLWGGTIVENIIQAICRDILTNRLLACEKAKLNPVLHAHDEIISEISGKNNARKIVSFKKIMNTPPDWLPGFPLKTEIETCMRYHK